MVLNQKAKGSQVLQTGIWKAELNSIAISPTSVIMLNLTMQMWDSHNSLKSEPEEL